MAQASPKPAMSHATHRGFYRWIAAILVPVVIGTVFEELN